MLQEMTADAPNPAAENSDMISAGNEPFLHHLSR